MNRHLFSVVKSASAAAMGFALAAFAGPVNAQTQTFTFLSPNNGYSSGAIVINMTGIGGVWAGRYDATLSSLHSGIKVFCTDFTHEIGNNQDNYQTLVKEGDITGAAQSLISNPGDGGNYYYQDVNNKGGGLVSALGVPADYNASASGIAIANRANAVAWLSDTYLRSNSLSKQQLGGVQLAIWDIIQDGGDGLGAGSVKTTDNSADATAAKTAAATYLTQANSHLNYKPSNSLWIQSQRNNNNSPNNHKQDFVYSVPEPVFYQMSALVMLGSLGLLKFRKREGVER